ncbi:OmpA family protein [Ideonella sp.]|uniref:OmpA family protein n=1 Tax=Ideonella sp. TaxID=1929293 RepID=UPI003BB683BD
MHTSKVTPHRAALCLLVGASITLAGCANMGARERGTAQGAALGAAGGAVISAATGGKAGTGALIGGAVGAIAGNIWSHKMEDKRKAMEAATKGTGVEVTRTQDNQLQVNVPSDISFDVGRATIKPELRPVLDHFAAGLDGTMQVRIVGHTDSTGSDAINNPLSVDRAESVKSYLADRGVKSGRITTDGRGSRQPVADNGSEAGRARNRRVEIFLSEPQTGY